MPPVLEWLVPSRLEPSKNPGLTSFICAFADTGTYRHMLRISRRIARTSHRQHRAPAAPRTLLPTLAWERPSGARASCKILQVISKRESGFGYAPFYRARMSLARALSIPQGDSEAA